MSISHVFHQCNKGICSCSSGRMSGGKEKEEKGRGRRLGRWGREEEEGVEEEEE